MPRRKSSNIVFSVGKHAKDKKPRPQEMSWSEFVEYMEDNITAGLGVSFKNTKSEDDYQERKSQQNYIAATYVDNRRNINNVDQRSLLFIDLDSVPAKLVDKVQDKLESLNIQYLGYSTPGDYSEFKDPDLRAVRFIIPVTDPIAADDIYETQCRFTAWLGIWETADQTAHQRSRIMYMPHREAEILNDPMEGKPFRVSRLAAFDWDPPPESGLTEWTPASLEMAEGKSAGVAEWAFENGLELMPSGRGWAVVCPNAGAHTGADGTDGSTAVLMPDNVHPEVRFQCQHDHCKELNRHQYLAFHMLGVPPMYSPQAHGVSRTQMRDIFGDAFHEDDLEEIRQAVSVAADRDLDDDECTEADLDDAPQILLSNKIPMIEGLINFRSPWELIGESNIGKTFYLLGMMACVAEGMPFAGQKTIRAHCFLIDGEGGESSAARKEALQKEYGADLEWLHIINLAQHEWDITSSAGQRRLIKHVRSIAGDDPVGLIGFDSLNQTMAFRDSTLKPFDENSAADMGLLVRGLKRISEETGGSPGVVHHPAKDKKGVRSARGSGALKGAVDYSFYLEQPDPEKFGQLNLYHEKARNSIKQSPRGFILKTTKGDNDGRDDALTERLQSRTEAPDFSALLGDLKPKPLSTGVRGETLFLVPVALEPFPDPNARALQDSKPSKEREVKLSKAQEKVLQALEELTSEDPDAEGFSKNKVCVKAGKGSGTMAAFSELIAMGLIVDAGGGQSWKIPILVSDTADAAPPDHTASEADLE